MLQDTTLRNKVYAYYTQFVKYAVANDSGYFVECGSEPAEVTVSRNTCLPVLHSRLHDRCRSAAPSHPAATADADTELCESGHREKKKSK